MNYSNMLIEELIREAHYTNNELALEIVKKMDYSQYPSDTFENDLQAACGN